MPPAPSLPLEKLAAIDAKLAAGLPRDRVLADAGITAETFERAHEAWFARMASEATHGKSRKLHKRYHDLLRAQRKEALGEQRQTSRKGDGKTPSPPAPRLSPLAAQYRPDAPRTTPKAETLPEVCLQSAAAVSLPVKPPPAVITTPPAAAPSNDDPLMRTVTVAQSPLRKEDALPFKASSTIGPTIGAIGKPAQPRRETLEFKAIDADAQTLVHTAPSKAPLPFATASQEPDPLEQTRYAFRSVPQKAASIDNEQTHLPTAPRNAALPFTPKPSPATFDEPQTQVPIRTAKKDALPFAGGSAAAPPRAASAPFDPQKNTGLPFQTPSPAPQNTAPTAHVNPALPFQPATAKTLTPEHPAGQVSAALPGEHLDLSRYACLCAELAAFPQESERVFARYGLAEARLRAVVDATWRQRLGEDAQLYRTWQEYYQHYYTQWFAKGRRP